MRYVYFCKIERRLNRLFTDNLVAMEVFVWPKQNVNKLEKNLNYAAKVEFKMRGVLKWLERIEFPNAKDEKTR